MSERKLKKRDSIRRSSQLLRTLNLSAAKLPIIPTEIEATIMPAKEKEEESEEPKEVCESKATKRKMDFKTSANTELKERLTFKRKPDYTPKPSTAALHMPHKELLQQITAAEIEKEPLIGMSEMQNKLKERLVGKAEKEPYRAPKAEKHTSSYYSAMTRFALEEERTSYTQRTSKKSITKKRFPPEIPDHLALLTRIRNENKPGFVYLTYAVKKNSEFFNPYCFKEVTYQETNGVSFTTVSRDGVTQFSPGEAVFTPLAKWTDNYIQYRTVVTIPGFAKFRLWKGFKVWQKGIAWRKYIKAQKILQDTLCILDIHLGRAILALRARMFHLTIGSFSDTRKIEDLPFFYFIEDQMFKYELIRDQLISLRIDALEIINEAMHASLWSKGFTIDDRNFAPPPKPGVKARIRADSMTFTQRANKRRCCGHLANFLATLDYYLITLLHGLLYWSFRNLKEAFQSHLDVIPSKDILSGTNPAEEVEKPRPQKYPQKPFFYAIIDVEPDRLTVDPSREIFQSQLNQLIFLWEKAILNFNRFLSDSFFKPFTQPIIMGKQEERVCGNPPSIKQVLDDDEYYQYERAAFFSGVQTAYDAVFLYLSRFETLREHFAQGLVMNIEKIKAERNLAVHRKFMVRITDELDFTKSIVLHVNLGLFYLQLEQLKETAEPVTRNLLAVMSYVLPMIGREKVAAINATIEMMNVELNRVPLKPQEFVDLLAFIDKASDMCTELDEVLAYSNEAYDMMHEFNVYVPGEDTQEHDIVTAELGILKSLVDRKVEEKFELTEAFNEHLGIEIRELIKRTQDIHDKVIEPWLIDAATNPEEAKATLAKLLEALLQCQREAAEYRNFQKAFRVEVTRFDILDEVSSEVRLRILLWESLETWRNLLNNWYTCDFNDLNAEDMTQITLKMLKNVTQLEKGLPDNRLVPVLKEHVEMFKERLPVIGYVRNPNLKARHWLQIEVLLKRKFPPDQVITLEQLDEASVFEFADDLMEIAGQASSEAALEGLLRKVENAWKETELLVVPHKESKDVFILAGLEELHLVLDESMININTISASRHVGPIKPRVDEWTRLLDLFGHTIDEWYNCQQSWMYLEAIFSAPDIQRQLPNEAKLFLIVDKSWKDLMRKTQKTPLALPAVTGEGVLEMLKKNNALLDQITKCLEAYLEVKRVAFPRFYFLSNDELLEILAQTKNPHAVQPHLRKCFDAIAKLEFGVKPLEEGDDPDAPRQLTTDITAMISPENEKVVFGKGLKARGSVEDWLCKVEEYMFTTLKRKMKVSLIDYDTRERVEWLPLHANQIILTVSQTMWARNVHQILETGAEGNKVAMMKDFERINILQLTVMAALARTDITVLLRKILCALITVDVHARDTITNLVTLEVTRPNDFEWLKMIRYYWIPTTEVIMARMANACLPYKYEYLGAGGVLVITPLTDRCYLCLMGALQMDLGGAPAGPAGTGKTETTKDLAKALAVQCVVFNCSEGLDFRMMGRFFSGLAQSGAWCCFDEFNRIDIEVLSVIAQQLVTIKNAKVAGANRFMFEGREIKLVRSCAAFITMNPGYAGRTELPDNLKALFRPMAMMVPDYGLIAEVILYSEGFESSKPLAQKMVNMYKLCSEQLSIQDHYDFGMRAVKSVLVMAGTLKRAAPEQREEVTLICALRDSNLPKFLADDAILFKGILGDLFPGIDLPLQEHGSLQEAIVYALEKKGMQPEECMVAKIIQLQETMQVRWGVMLVGPTGGGKTTCLHALGNALGRLFELGEENPYYRPVKKYTMNPKAIHISELYGEVNLATLEWRDGLLGLAVRAACSSTEEMHQWVINDGPVDAVWIENLNTVLDDNKMLCLANSERIKLTPWVHMIFEVQDLSQASPATVSRCGMVYVDPDDLGWFPYVKSWGDRLPDNTLLPQNLDIVYTLFKGYVGKVFTFIRKHCEIGIHQVDISKITMLCCLLKVLFTKTGPDQGIGFVGGEPKVVRTFIVQTFVWCTLWSLGGNLEQDSRVDFEEFMQDSFSKHMDAKLPREKYLWDLYMNTQIRQYDEWSAIVPDFQYSREVPFFEMLVPTIDTARFGHVAQLLLDARQPVMMTGDTGVGKSVIAKAVLMILQEQSTAVPVIINFSAQTSSLRTQEMLEIRLEKKRRKLFGAPAGKYLIMFVDDVNMPKLEIYGAQPPIELLRQLLDFNGLYDRQKMFWKRIENVVLACACAPPGGGRNPLTPRFVRHFSMLLIPPPQEISLKVIFQSILKGFFFDFSPMIREIAEPLISAAVDIYNRIAEELLPTPAKSHYVFNLRDLSKCVQGVLQADAGTMREASAMSRLFCHECLRVFHDRLINEEDKTYFKTLMAETCTKYLGNPVVKPGELILFGDFMLVSVPKEERVYEEILNIGKLKAILQEYLEDYNVTTGKEMQIILFLDAIEHTTRLARLLRAERGNGLLIGISGMGKQSLTKLGAHVNEYKCCQIELTRGYDHSTFHEDLRKFYWFAGALDQPTVFLFTDTQIIKEEFLEDVNNMLNSGEVPNLFESDEYEKVIIACRNDCIKTGVEATRDAIYNFFISRVRANLHLVICMSPVGDAFRRRCRMFPSLVNCCTIDWFVKWPQEALLSVAKRSLREMETPQELIMPMSNTCVLIHETVEQAAEQFYADTRRRYYVTPSSYLELIKLYHSLLEKQTDKISAKRARIATGLRKINETNEIVGTMEQELTDLEPELAKKSVTLAALMAKLEKEQAAGDIVAQQVGADEAEAKEKAADTQILADDAQRDLDTALPALEAAQEALKSLNKNDINELRVFQKPPQLVQVVMEAVCILLGAKPDWATAKLIMGEGNFLQRLELFDKDHIPEKNLQKLKPYIANKSFEPDIVVKVSKVAKSMCMWVRAIDLYAKVYKIVEPKRLKLEAAEAEMDKVMTVLRAKQAQLAEVEAYIHGLQEMLQNSLMEQQALEANIELCAARLSRAGRLTSALSDEEVRWKQTVLTLGKDLWALPGNILIASACISYLGAFSASYRNVLIKQWTAKIQELSIPSSAVFDLVAVLGDAYDIRMWNQYGLPRDSMSTENGILTTKSSRYSLAIDPQEQANRWIRNMEKEHNLRITKMTDPNLLRIMEAAIRNGLPVLLEEVAEFLDPTLAPILGRQTFIQNGRLLIHLGDSDVDYDPKFRLYMTSKLSNPHYLPEVCIQVTIVNFMVTPSGLEDQLLADVVRLERPDLEAQRTELIVRINTDRQQLQNLEDRVLYLLFTSGGCLLDDETLVETLNESKETSAVIAARLIEAEATEIKITTARERYRPLAARGSVLYFVVAQLADVDPMYQFSLKYFNMIFNHVIEITPKVTELEERLQNLMDEEILAMYINISRGLFEQHKVLYSFLLSIAVERQCERLDEEEWSFLLRGPVGTKVEPARKPDIPALSDYMWLCTNHLPSAFPKFEGIVEDCLNDIDVILGDFEQLISIPGGTGRKSKMRWNQKLSDFQKLLLLKSLQEEKLVFAIGAFVRVTLGKIFTESPPISLQSLFKDMNSITPLVFVLSAGSDPLGPLQKFATEVGMMSRLECISLGQGQGPVAEALLDKGRAAGMWIYLQNCHLATSWMPRLEKIVRDLALGVITAHTEFRLFTSSMPAVTFPVSILQNSVKVTNEPPKGIRANVRGALIEMEPDFFENNPMEQNWRSMVFGIVLFHAIVLERRKFGPLGWNITYEFSVTDRECALINLQMFCSEAEGGHVPWDALEYITGWVTYGGRVTDAWDQRCLKTILQQFFSAKTLVPNYKYSESGTYYCPQYETLEEFRDFADHLPYVEPPEVFGMHENANIAYQTKETQSLINTLLEGAPSGGGGGGAGQTDTFVYEKAQEIIDSVMERVGFHDPHKSLTKRDAKGRNPSLTTVLFQELDRFNKLLKLLHSSLDNLQKAIKGFVVMSDILENVYNAFINNQVPALWKTKSYPSLKSLGTWVHDLQLRLDFIESWHRNGLPHSFWISGFFFPQGFMTGALQTHARKYNLPIDKLKFDFKVMLANVEQEEIYKAHRQGQKDNPELYGSLEAPDDGVLVHGLFMDACRWSFQTMVLEEQKPGEMSPILPAMQLVPTTEVVLGTRYEAPLYKTSLRAGVLSTTGHSTNFVVTVQLPSSRPQAFWIMQGAALLTQTTD